MDNLPIHVQSRIYKEAGVNGVCSASRDELLHAALLADQRDLDTPFEDGEDSPAPSSTWRVALMVTASPQTVPQLAAVLERLGTRFSQLQHVSLDVNEHCGQYAEAGLSNILEHGSAALSHATRLTVRGDYSRPMCHAAPLPWRRLSFARLRFSCTRLDVTSDMDSLYALLSDLSNHFPAAQDVRVRLLPTSATGPALLFRVDAPDSLTHLHVLFSDPTSEPQCLAVVIIDRAEGLQELSVLFLPAPIPLGGSQPVPAAGDHTGGAGGDDGAIGSDGSDGGNGDGSDDSYRTFVDVNQATALHTLRGFCQSESFMNNGNSLPALRHIEATFHGGPAHATDLLQDVKIWLQEWHAQWAPGLVSMRLRLWGNLLTVADSASLLVWAATSLRYSLVLVAE